MYKSDNYEFDTPLMFKDGSKVYSDLAKRYTTHKKGLFILAPSGAGKTYYIQNQKENHWIDGDELWMATNAHPKFGWWLEGLETINRVEMQSDVITVQAKEMGFWILGSANYWLNPDGIVLPDWDTHKKYIKAREDGDYDGGATSDKLQQVLNHREVIKKWAKEGVPEFKSVEEAVEKLTKGIK